MNGKSLWRYMPENIQTGGMGTGTSAVLAGKLLVLPCDSSDGTSKMVALTRKNGETVWTTKRKTMITWSMPLPVSSGGK